MSHRYLVRLTHRLRVKGERMDGGKLTDEMDMLLGTTSADADAAELPFESIDDFSTDPVSFTEMSERMLERVEMIFELSTLYNRQSADYLRICAVLEKGIKYLAGSCIVKAAMEQEKMTFPTLGQLSLAKLYGMASFNYRKLDTALSEQIRKSGRNFSPELLDMDFRYFNLLARLRATHTKKYNYFFGYFYNHKGNDGTITGRAFGNKQYDCGPKSEPPVFRRPSAFPMDRAAIAALREEQNGKSGNTLNNTENNISNTLTILKEINTRPTHPETDRKSACLPQPSGKERSNRLNIVNNNYEIFLNESFTDQEDFPAPGAAPAEKKAEKKVSARELKQEFDENLQLVWEKYSRMIAEERKGGRAPGA